VIIDSDNESTVSVHAATEIELAASGFKFPKGQLRGKPIELEP
jgi:hypothetical protein